MYWQRSGNSGEGALESIWRSCRHTSSNRPKWLLIKIRFYCCVRPRSWRCYLPCCRGKNLRSSGRSRRASVNPVSMAATQPRANINWEAIWVIAGRGIVGPLTPFESGEPGDEQTTEGSRPERSYGCASMSDRWMVCTVVRGVGGGAQKNAPLSVIARPVRYGEESRPGSSPCG